MSKNEKSEALKFVAMGDGIEYAVEASTLHLRVNLDASKGTASASGKMILTGNTGGWQVLPGGDGVRLNVMVGRKVAPLNRAP